jgi:hypothetical protein
VLANFTGARYLPLMAGCNSVWEAQLNGVSIARTKGGVFISLISEVQYAQKNYLHFKYCLA